MDFDSVSVDLTFGPVETISSSCRTVLLFPDTVIENKEMFSINITSTDLNVVIKNQSATAFIQDTSSVDVDTNSDVYTVREEDEIVEVCAVLSGATLQREIQVTFLTQDSTATGVSSEMKLTLTVTNSCI